MNRKWMIVVGVALILAMAVLVGCNARTTGPENIQVSLNGQQEGIWVNGSGKVSAVPDVAILSLGIESQQVTVAQAQTEAAGAMDKVMAALKAQGVAVKDIQTQSFNIQKVTRWDNDKQQEIILGYRVSNMVTARIRAVEKAGTVIDAVAAAGGDLTRINSIGFTVDDPNVYYQQARQKAMADASAKGQQLADLGGVKLGKPTYISENTYVPGPIYRQDMVAKAEGAPAVVTPVSPGEMEITVNVQLAYAITN